MNNPLCLEVQAFLENLLTSFDYDYGDFMRSTNLYLHQLERSLSPIHDPRIRDKLSEIRHYVQFKPNWDIESTRERVIQDIRALNELILGSKFLSSEIYQNTVEYKPA